MLLLIANLGGQPNAIEMNPNMIKRGNAKCRSFWLKFQMKNTAPNMYDTPIGIIKLDQNIALS